MKKFIGSKSAVVGLCAVLVAVSAFFYAPMEVSAEEVRTISQTISSQSFGVNFGREIRVLSSNFVVDSTLSDDSLYALDIDFDFEFNNSIPLRVFDFNLAFGTDVFCHIYDPANVSSTVYSDTHIFSYNGVFILEGSELNGDALRWGCTFLSQQAQKFDMDVSFTYKVNSVVPLSGSQSEAYQQGYNVGYLEGLEVGESNGYSSGYSDGFEAGEQSGYDSGFEAGQDSVDKESYYDLGFSAGYDAGYLAGYDVGYEQGHDDGYAQAVANLTKYGADATTYPVHLGTVSDTNTHVTLEPIYNQPADMTWIPYEFDISSYKIDPLYNYRILGLLDEFCFGGQFYQYSKASVFLQVGGKDYYIGSWSGGYDTKFSPGFQIYVPGSEMGTKLAIKVVAYNCAGTTEKQQYSYPYINLITSKCTMTVSNMGPASAEANQIANQTDVLNNTLEEQTEVLEEQVETQKGIAKSLKDFFGSFFDNFVDSVIGIFVPSTEEMESLFNRLNDFFAETFGFLYYPFDFIIDAFNVFLEADSGTGLTLPSFSIMGYEVWGDQTYDLNSEPLVGEIFGYVRIGTGALLAMWFVNYLRNFFDKRFGGGGS